MAKRRGQKKRRGGKIPGGTPIDTSGDALLNFVLNVDAAAARKDVSTVTRQLQAMQRAQQGAGKGVVPPGGGRPVGGRVAVPPVVPVGGLHTGASTGDGPKRSVVIGTSAKKTELGWMKRHFALGAEGVRVGDVRLSRSGVSVSEKTFVGSSGHLAAVAAGGQVVGHVVRSIAEIRDAAQGVTKDSVGDLIYTATIGTAFDLIRGGTEIFGFGLFTPGFRALITGESFDDSRQAYDEVWRKLQFGWEKEEGQKELKLARRDIRSWIEYQRNKRKIIAQKMNNPRLKSQHMIEQIREELAADASEDRAMTRSATGRPLWKVVGYADTEGIP